jgi:hypothetical protein
MSSLTSKGIIPAVSCKQLGLRNISRERLEIDAVCERLGELAVIAPASPKAALWTKMTQASATTLVIEKHRVTTENA